MQLPARPQVYLLVWVGLLALLALTILAAYARLGAYGTALHFTIAATQAALVMLFSMHLASAHPLMRAIALIGFIGIAILVLLTLLDVLTR